jgi:hypothetical protein
MALPTLGLGSKKVTSMAGGGANSRGQPESGGGGRKTEIRGLETGGGLQQRPGYTSRFRASRACFSMYSRRGHRAPAAPRHPGPAGAAPATREGLLRPRRARRSRRPGTPGRPRGRCYSRYRRASTAKYNFDPNHIGVWGTFAGGHLVALLGTTGRVKALKGSGGNLDQ